MKTKIGIIGDGNVGGALQRGLERAGFEVKATGKDDDDVRRIVDVTNALTPEYQLAVGFTTSGAEELQRKVPGAKVVKAFNTVFAGTMDTGRANGQQLTALVASDDDDARKHVRALAAAIGFDAVDAGPLRNARQNDQP